MQLRSLTVLLRLKMLNSPQNAIKFLRWTARLSMKSLRSLKARSILKKLPRSICPWLTSAERLSSKLNLLNSARIFHQWILLSLMHLKQTLRTKNILLSLLQAILIPSKAEERHSLILKRIIFARISALCPSLSLKSFPKSLRTQNLIPNIPRSILLR